MRRCRNTICRPLRPILLFLMVLCLMLTTTLEAGEKPARSSTRPGDPLQIAVMDPMARQLSCECAEGQGQRDYDRLAVYLQDQLDRPVRIAFTQDLAALTLLNNAAPELIIGQESLVACDAVRQKLDIRPLARLTDRDGKTTIRGLFIVRAEHPAGSLADLEGYEILFGLRENRESYAEAIEALRAADVDVSADPPANPAPSVAAMAVAEGEADAAVIPQYAEPLLTGSGRVQEGTLKVIGRTAPTPFITAFATPALARGEEQRAVVRTLISAREQPDVLEALQSKDGFVSVHSETAETGWTDWRGPGRDGLTDAVPTNLPEEPRLLWRTKLTGWGLSGVAVKGRYVIIADKDAAARRDVWRCLHADTGEEVWSLRYEAAGDMDFSNSPRAMPLIRGNRAYLLGAFGHLHCVELQTGRVLWKKHLVKDLGGRRPPWGYSATPLITGEKIVVNPGAKDGCLVALNRYSGVEIWRSPGAETAYASPVIARLGGQRQIVTYDSISLGGWDPATGKRLWKVLPEYEGDFNVPTPVLADDKLFVATENNGARLYAFDDRGKARGKPSASFEDLLPDTTTPVVMDDLALGACAGRLFCLDARHGLEPLWELKDNAFYDHVSLVAGDGRLLVISVGGDLILMKVRRDRPRIISHINPFTSDRTEVWSHPALVGNRLYVRNRRSVSCLELAQSK